MFSFSIFNTSLSISSSESTELSTSSWHLLSSPSLSVTSSSSSSYSHTQASNYNHHINFVLFTCLHLMKISTQIIPFDNIAFARMQIFHINIPARMTFVIRNIIIDWTKETSTSDSKPKTIIITLWMGFIMVSQQCQTNKPNVFQTINFSSVCKWFNVFRFMYAFFCTSACYLSGLFPFKCKRNVNPALIFSDVVCNTIL